MPNDDLCFTPATELAAAIRARTLSPVELTDALLARIEAVNPRVNAYCTVAAERARADARAAESALMSGAALGPLHGVPVSFKDLTPTAGIRTTFGSRAFEHHVPAEDALIVTRTRQAGAVVIGKTNTPEFGCKGVTDNAIFGHTRNPWNLGMNAGGSSGGAAAAVAAGISPIAEGSDLAGSIRIPSAACGVVGLKPSLGRAARVPALNAWTGLSTQGPITRTVRDAALFLSVIAGPDERDPQSLPATGEDFARAADGGVRGVRVGFSVDLGFAPVDGEVRRLVEAAAKTLSTLGCVVEDAHPGFANPRGLFIELTAPYRAAAMQPLVARWRDQMDPAITSRLDSAAAMSAVDFEKAQHRRTEMWQTLARFFDRHDVLVTPTTSVPAFPLGVFFPEAIEGRTLENQLDWFPFTYPFNITGSPAISVPCGFTAGGLPVGLQIVGRRFADATVLRVAAAYEAAAPWIDRRPAL